MSDRDVTVSATGDDGVNDPRIVEIHLRRAMAAEMGGAEAVARHHENGRLTVRERITALTDDGSFREIGTLTGTGEYDDQHRLVKVTPAPYVAGVARIGGRPVAIGGEDFTVRGGTSFGALRRKGGQGGFIEDLAHHYRMPLVNLDRWRRRFGDVRANDAVMSCSRASTVSSGRYSCLARSRSSRR